jgi:DNA-binding transcriptional regulator YhcF (GntR family)
VTTAYGRPAYQQVADDLRDLIARGRLAVGEPIPSTTGLCKQYGVSATVARAAVAKLREEGIVRGQPGKAVFVVATPQSVKDEGARLEDVAGQVQEIRNGLDSLAAHVEDAMGSTTVGELRRDVDELRRQLGVLQAQVIDLYGRTGHPYPRDELQRAQPTEAREAT